MKSKYYGDLFLYKGSVFYVGSDDTDIPPVYRLTGDCIPDIAVGHHYSKKDATEAVFMIEENIKQFIDKSVYLGNLVKIQTVVEGVIPHKP